MEALIKEDSKYEELVNMLLGKIYNYKIQGINTILLKKFHNNDYIYITRTTSNIKKNICLDIIKLSFLASIKIGKKKVFYENLFGPCIECGLVKAQHKYKSCGHYVCPDCALWTVINTNKCNQCKKPIIKKKIKIIKDKQKETCSICLTDCKTKLYKCGHYFHKQCIKECHKISNKCPMCREDLTNNVNKKEYIDTEFDLGNNCGGFVDIITHTI